MEEYSKSGGRTRTGLFKRIMTLLLVFVTLVQLCPLQVFAEWDGSGSSGDTGSTEIVGGFSASSDAMVGYRFSVYDVEGDKIGYSVDVDFKYIYNPGRRAAGDNKQSHIDLYRAYLKDSSKVDVVPTTSIGDRNGFQTTWCSNPESAYYYGSYANDVADHVRYEPALAGLDPTEIGYDAETNPDGWLTPLQALTVASWCNALDGYDADTAYIIVEPYYWVVLENIIYFLTVAELAVTIRSIPQGFRPA